MQFENYLDENSKFGEWADLWTERKTYGQSYKYCQSIYSIVKHLQCIYNKPINQVRTIDIDDVILKLSVYNVNTKKPASRKLLKNVKQTAVSIFKFAINNCENLYKNPAELVEIPQDTVKNYRKPLSMAEQAIVIETPHRARLAALIMMFCGLRLGELIALQWSNIDFNKRILHICQSAYNVNGNQLQIKPGTKNGKCRNITIPDILLKRLIDEYLSKSSKTEFVITKSDGISMHTRSSWSRMWQSYNKALDLSFTAHQLRHTYATMLYYSGVDIKSASELLGHSNIEITMNIYTHLMNENKIIPISKYDQFLKENFGEVC
ncbi:MAG: site-specific integrase [Clostridia bacterium]|nr:site-specific integrase [Clostridia bacterium]